MGEVHDVAGMPSPHRRSQLSAQSVGWRGRYLSLPSIEPAPIKPIASVDDLEKLDVRIGTIREVQDVAESDKLVRLRVDFGDHQRTILVGMKRERDDPREVEGRQALFVLNLPPRKLFGHTSEGMLLDIGHLDGISPVLAVPERQVPNGSRAG